MKTSTLSEPDTGAAPKEIADLRQLYEQRFEGQPLSPTQNLLYEAVHDFLAGAGKRIRPLLCLMGCDLFAGPLNKALGPAHAIELFHNFTLIHDDIMDQADLRRGRPTVHKHYGENTAILAGDLVLIHAYEFLAQTEPVRLSSILGLFNRTAMEIIEGQQDDLEFEEREEVTLEEYLRMIAGKTSVLLAASLQIGAIVAGATTRQQQLIYDFGKNLGLSFQIRDDFLDAFGAGEQTGKRVGGDILQNKKTYLHVAAWEAADPGQKEEMRRLSLEEDEDRKITGMVGLYQKLGADRQAEAAMRSFYDSALENLDAIDAPGNRKTVLRAFAEKVFTRNR